MLPIGKRPQPVPRPGGAAAPPVRIPPGAIQRTLIDTKDFEAGEPWRAGAGVVLARFRVPEDAAFFIGASSRMEFYLRNRAAVPGGYDNSAGATAYALTVSTPGIVRTKMRAPALPTDRHPEVLAYAQVAPSTAWTLVPVQAIDYNAGTVTLSVPAGEHWTAVEVYYVGAQGEFRLYVVREGGGLRDWITIHNNSFAAVHTLDQASREEALVVGNQAGLVEGFQLALEVTSPYEVVWNDRARHYLKIESLALRIPGADKDTLRRALQLLMRGGL